MSDKRKLIIEVEAGKVTCGECEWHKGDDADDGECLMFDRSLVDGVVRCPECLAAEDKANDMMLKTAMAKAAPQAI